MHDFIAIGDIVNDAFIKLKDAHVSCDVDNENCTISMSFGDKIPYESVEVANAVGNSPNAAVSASRLGLNSALVTNLGDDQNGRDCLESLKKNKVVTDFITIHKGKETNYHYVLWFENDRTILVKHQEYDRKLPDIGKPKWLYLSSLGEDTLQYHKQIAEYLKINPEINLAFQPGTFQMKLGKEELKDIYTRAKIFFCNVEEAEKILGLNTLGLEELLKRIQALGPEIVVITDGPKGAHAFDGKNVWCQPPYPDPKVPFERTGAGDAFASTTVVSLALNNDLPTALSWGAINSMSVVQQVGAQKGLLSMEKLEEYLKNAPANFKATKI
ncbi:MAG: Sugar kinase, ribokinase family [Parcubacteria group bacterium GW2011_GWC1_39_8]|nr:MAG: Sugar kinase, ribokinase family [Parcubacteria group bacterium GW2011_GWC1_39_8]